MLWGLLRLLRLVRLWINLFKEGYSALYMQSISTAYKGQEGLYKRLDDVTE